jgi:hypothetical protein
MREHVGWPMVCTTMLLSKRELDQSFGVADDELTLYIHALRKLRK